MRRLYADLMLFLWCTGFLCGAEMGRYPWLYRCVAGIAFIVTLLIAHRLAREFRKDEREFASFMADMRRQHPEFEWRSSRKWGT